MIRVSVSAFDCESMIGACLASIAAQDCDFTCVVLDDASRDHTGDIAADFAAKDARFRVLRAEENGGPMRSQVACMSALGCDPDDLVVIVDGDDALASESAFVDYQLHHRDGADVLWGDYLDSNGALVRGSDFSRATKAERSYRLARWSCFPLRAFRAALFEGIDLETYFAHQGRWFRTSTDKALFYCLLERARQPRYVPGARYRIGLAGRSDPRAAIVSNVLIRRLPPLRAL